MAGVMANLIGTAYALLWARRETPLLQQNRPRIYTAEAPVGGGFLPIWAALGLRARRNARPVVASEIMAGKKFRPWLLREIFNALPMPRGGFAPSVVGHMAAPLEAGESLIVFMETMRGKNGSLLHAILTLSPNVEVIPVGMRAVRRFGVRRWRLHFGPPLELGFVEDAPEFMDRLQRELGALR